MQFKDHIPEKVLEFPNASRFVEVLDGVREEKQSLINGAFRYYNPALFTDPKWLVERLAEWGFTDMPIDYPIDCLQLLLLNAGTILRLRGSELGWRLLINALTHVEPQDKFCYDNEKFMQYRCYAYAEERSILMDSALKGYATEDNSETSFYLTDDLDDIRQEVSALFKVSIYSGLQGYEYRKQAFENLVSTDIVEEEYGKRTFWMDYIPYHGFNVFKIRFRYYSSMNMTCHKLLNTYFQ